MEPNQPTPPLPPSPPSQPAKAAPGWWAVGGVWFLTFTPGGVVSTASFWGAIVLGVLTAGIGLAGLVGRLPVRMHHRYWVAIIAGGVFVFGSAFAQRDLRDQRVANERAVAASERAQTARSHDERRRREADLQQRTERASALLTTAEAAADAQRFTEADAALRDAQTLLEPTPAQPSGPGTARGRAAALAERLGPYSEALSAVRDATAATSTPDRSDLSSLDAQLSGLQRRLGAVPPNVARALGAVVDDAKRNVSSLRREIAAGVREEQLANRNAARALRDVYAQRLDADLIRAGIESSSFTKGRDGTILHVDSFMCGRVFMDRLAPGSAQPTLRQLGFTRVECASAFQRSWVDL